MMSKETRQAHSRKLSILASARGHDASVAHAFNHTEGQCPKCGSDKHLVRYCYPNQGRNVPHYPNCELDGEHLHRGCGACRYQWIERCLDQAMLSEERGEIAAESELAALLAALCSHTGGVSMSRETLYQHRGWILKFVRDGERDFVTVTSEAPPPQVGEPGVMPQSEFEEGL
jgi:hypothetical protein